MDEQNQVAEYDLDLKEEVIYLKKGGVRKKYVIREVTGKKRDKYLQFMQSRTKFDKAGNPVGMTNMEGIFSELIQDSVFDENNNPVKTEDSQAWPSSAQTDIYKKCIKISKLNAADDKTEEPLKNE